MNARDRGVRTVLSMNWSALARKHSLNALTAALFLLAAWRVGLNAELPAVLAFIFGGVLLAVIDWRVQRLPTRLVYLTLAGVVAGQAFASLIEWDWKHLATALVGAACFAGVYCAIWYAQRFIGFVLLGFGDVRLAALLGAVLGWYGLDRVMQGAIVGHFLALVVGLVLCIRERKLRLHFAFGPPLLLGALAIVLIHP
jgi:leader peptidase (prepilin peptidase)/N-methyltransferase